MNNSTDRLRCPGCSDDLQDGNCERCDNPVVRRIELRYIPGDGWESRLVVEDGRRPGEGEGLSAWRSLMEATSVENAARMVMVRMSMRCSSGAVLSLAEGWVLELQRLADVLGESFEVEKCD